MMSFPANFHNLPGKISSCNVRERKGSSALARERGKGLEGKRGKIKLIYFCFE